MAAQAAWRRLSGSTPFRLALWLVLASSVALTVLMGAAALAARARLVAALEAEMEAQIESLDATPDVAALEALVAAQAEGMDQDQAVLAFLGPDGRVVGNARATLGPDGARVEDGDDDGYLLRAEPMLGGTLIVGRSRAPVSDLGEALTTLLLLGLVPTVAVMLGLGLLLARRADRRVRGIEAALAAIAAGDLAARAPEARDGTDLDRIAQSLNRAARAQAAAVDSLRQVSTDIAHDLRTPIQRVAVLLDRLTARAALAPEAAGLVAQATEETARIARTFQALLQIAQIEGGQARDRFGPVDLRDLARDLVSVYEPAAEDSGHALGLRVEGPGPFTVRGDRDLLAQVLANLIENGLRHVPKGGRVEVGVAGEAGRATLRVRDDGPGIPEAERGNVLRRLYRLERSRTTDGSGLGLSLVAAACELHGARLALGDAAPGLEVSVAFGTTGGASGDGAGVGGG